MGHDPGGGDVDNRPDLRTWFLRIFLPASLAGALIWGLLA